MNQLMQMDWIEAVGWLASLLTIATYSMNTMIPLRLFAIASSVGFIFYALALQIWPLLAMELVLLPINAYRLRQILTLRRRLSRVGGDEGDPFAVVRTYVKLRRIEAGTFVFHRGDPVDSLYYIASGRVLIEEVGVEVSAGDIFGEMAFFTDASTRTATARCVEDALVYELDKTRFMRLQFEDPSFGMSVMRTITRRLAAGRAAEPGGKTAGRAYA